MESVAPRATSWVDKLRPSRLRLLAPLLSIAILIGLIARVSDCGGEPGAYPRTDLAWPHPSRATKQSRFVPLRGTKSFGIEGPDDSDPGVLRSTGTLGGTKSPPVEMLGSRPDSKRQPYQNGPGLDALNSLGGSKSGFGGLGIRGTGRSLTADPAPSLGDVGALGHPQAPAAAPAGSDAR